MRCGAGHLRAELRVAAQAQGEEIESGLAPSHMNTINGSFIPEICGSKTKGRRNALVACGVPGVLFARGGDARCALGRGGPVGGAGVPAVQSSASGPPFKYANCVEYLRIPDRGTGVQSKFPGGPTTPRLESGGRAATADAAASG